MLFNWFCISLLCVWMTKLMPLSHQVRSTLGAIGCFLFVWRRHEVPKGEKYPLVAQILNLISVLCCHLENHTFRKPITVVSFEEPINELRQILSQFDDMETNFSPPATRGQSLAFYFSFQWYLFSTDFWNLVKAQEILIPIVTCSHIFLHPALPIWSCLVYWLVHCPLGFCDWSE